MAGLKLISKDGEPLKYADRETGEKLNTRSYLDVETGAKVLFVLSSDPLGATNKYLEVVHAPAEVMKKTAWKVALGLDVKAVGMCPVKKCNAIEVTRLKSISEVEALTI